MDPDATLGDSKHLIVLAIVVILVGFVFSRSRSGRRAKLHLPPGPRGLPVVGSLLSLGKVPHVSFVELSKRYGPLMYMRLGSKPTLVVGNSDMMREVLQTNDQLFASRPPLALPTIIFYDNVDIAFAPFGPHWREARKICTLQLFTASRLNHFSGIIEREIMATIEFVLQGSESGKSVNLTNLFSGLPMNIITQMMWGKRHRNISNSNHSATDKLQELVDTIAALSGPGNIADYLPFLRFFTIKLPGLERKARTVHREVDEFLEQIVCEREELLSKDSKGKTTTDANDDDADDLLDVLLRLMNLATGDSQGLSRNAVKAILLDMLLGGTDTSANTLDWTFAELMRHPDVMERAQDELSTMIGSDRLVTQADIPNLKYLAALVKEILRFHGPAPLTVPHLSTGDCKVGGYDVPANTTVLLNMYAIHNDPAYWDKPREFNPDRFLDSDVDFKGRHFQLLPFSSGRRICPGINLASTVLHLGLAQMLHMVNWYLPEGETPESVDMTECAGLNVSRTQPLILIAKPRLSQDIVSSLVPSS